MPSMALKAMNENFTLWGVSDLSSLNYDIKLQGYPSNVGSWQCKPYWS